MPGFSLVVVDISQALTKVTKETSRKRKPSCQCWISQRQSHCPGPWLHPGYMSSLRARLGPALSLVGPLTFGSTLSISDCSKLETPLSLRLAAQLDPSPPFSGVSCLSSRLPWTYYKMELSTPAWSCASVDSPLAVLDFLRSGSASFSQSFSQLESPLPAPDCQRSLVVLGSSLSKHSKALKTKSEWEAMEVATNEMISAALSDSANRAPPRAEDCSFCFIRRKWLSAKEVSQLDPRRRSLLRNGAFEVCKQNRVAMCKRCGQQIPKSSVRISYPSTVTSRNTLAVTVQLHVDCAVKEFEILQQIAQQGINDKEYVEEHIIGFEALKKSEQKCLLQSLQQPVQLVPEELPASQVKADVTLTPHETPQQLREPLKLFQQEGLSWLLQREAKAEGNEGRESGAHVLRGGILADEMGMGKTLQIIALLVASPASGATLVVVPPTCLAQWRAEIAEFVEPGTLEIFEYRCNKSLPEHFNGKAVVLTTYSTLERDFRKQLDTLEEPPRKRRRGELLRDQEVSWWDEQLQIDLSKSPLFGRRWTRIVLDEAHRIKNARGSTAQAAFNLRAQRRWCVSGTPMQNRIGEVGSLVRFLRFYPYGFNRCQRRGCNCICLFVNADNTSLCQACGHRKTQHCSVFAKKISTPIRQFGFTGEGKAALESLRLEIFHQLMLRRTKSTLDLPKLSITKKKVSLSERESRTYTRIKTRDRQILQNLIAEGKLMQNFAHVFSIIMRQRQAANHPQLAKFGLSSDCPFCTNPVDEMDEETEVLPCGFHACHQWCHIEYMRDAPDEAEFICPCERELYTAKPLRAASIVDGLQDAGQPIRTSSKIEALIQEIEAKLQDSSPEPQKFLVFSSFAHFLELCGYFMDEAEITNAIISGKTDIKSRARIIQQFRETDLSVLLISLQVGGEGLNLQVANRVYLLDPWWNPAMEQQAYQRAHRLGQKREVEVVRFVSDGTIEEKILQLQERKQCTFDSTVAGCNESLLKLTSDDIQMLFRD
eukprot:s210_g4.t1